MSRTIDDLYEQDFFAWTQLQARELDRFRRTRPNLPLDLRHLAEEIRDLGKEQRNALRSWLTLIVHHLLLLEHSPAEAPCEGWEREITTFRISLRNRLTATLRRDLERRLPVMFEEARTSVEQKLLHHGEVEAAGRLPTECPYMLDQILGDWWPSSKDRPASGR